MMLWYGHDMGWLGFAGVAIAMAVFWVLVIGCIVALVKYLVDDRHAQAGPPAGAQSPADLLAARFARGELSETEYRDRSAVLRESSLIEGLGQRGQSC